ncbi:MAG: DUF4190 domain-containing protein [Pedosphaera sp.]|nr:DUF4190 domain-containing protein [Pedosphaera sp.]
MQITCPACKGTLIVPQPPPETADAPTVAVPRREAPPKVTHVDPPARASGAGTAAPPAPREPAVSAPPPKRESASGGSRAASSAGVDFSNSGLAVASLVSACTVAGFLPAIICGHLAKQELRKNPHRGGGGFATAGLVLGYIGAAVAIAALVFWLTSSRDTGPVVVGFDRSQAADNPFAVGARMRAAEAGRPFGEFDEPATVSFVNFEGAGKDRSIKVRIANHADKPIRSLDMKLNFQNNAGVVLARANTSKSARPFLVNTATTVEVTLKVDSVPDRADSAAISLARAEYADGTEWKRPQ